MRILLCPPLQPFQDMVDQDAKALKYWPEYVNIHWQVWEEGLKINNVSLENLVYEEEEEEEEGREEEEEVEVGKKRKRGREGPKKVITKLIDLDLPPPYEKKAEEKKEDDDKGKGKEESDDEEEEEDDVEDEDENEGDDEDKDKKIWRRTGTMTENITFMSICRLTKEVYHPSSELKIPYRWCLESFFWILNYLCAEPASMLYSKRPYDKGGLAFLWGDSSENSLKEKRKRLKYSTRLDKYPTTAIFSRPLRLDEIRETESDLMPGTAAKARFLPGNPFQSEFRKWLLLVRGWQLRLRDEGSWDNPWGWFYDAVWSERKRDDWSKEGMRKDELETRDLFLFYLERLEESKPYGSFDPYRPGERKKYYL